MDSRAQGKAITMKIEGLEYPYELKLYSPNDPDFTEHWRIKYPYNDSGKDVIAATAMGHLILVRKGNKPIYTGEILTDQLEFPLSYLKWLLGVISRFQLKPNKGGYPPGTFSDELQMDEENWLGVRRGQNFGLGGLFGYGLENSRRHSYIDNDFEQEFFITDDYLFEMGLMDALIKIEKDYTDGKL